jgi:hypothetical protein
LNSKRIPTYISLSKTVYPEKIVDTIQLTFGGIGTLQETKSVMIRPQNVTSFLEYTITTKNGVICLRCKMINLYLYTPIGLFGKPLSSAENRRLLLRWPALRGLSKSDAASG